MHRPVIDGDRWIAQRLKFLRELLESDVSDEQRAAIEAEIGILSRERGIHPRGPRLFRSPLRWWNRR